MPNNQDKGSARTRAGAAGQPQTGANMPAAATPPPTAEELDRREQMKTGPRRQAGPPLEGDTAEPMPMEALPDAALPAETTPSQP
jgi:hypothetical protein